MKCDARGIWIDIHIGRNKTNPEFTKRRTLVYPGCCGGRSLQEYFLQYEPDIAHNFIHKLMETIKELDGIDVYRQAQLKLRKLGIDYLK